MKNLIRDLLAAGLHRLQLTNPAASRREHLYIATFHRVLPEELRRRVSAAGIGGDS